MHLSFSLVIPAQAGAGAGAGAGKNLHRVARRASACALPLLLAACALDAPRLAYQCPEQLSFEARLYQDMALLEGLRGHVVLERMADDTAALQYADPTVRATFGLGLEQRLVRLDYTSIPTPVYCERPPAADGAPSAPVQAAERPGPRPPPPFDPDAPVETNVRFGDGPPKPY
ncbi:MAG: hypothetical protein LBQ32_12265 [Burkholderiaceae bacterium]|jgi:hypothetical protein|nr:hypothetical protein [Burkholderiaceae bacterium]